MTARRRAAALTAVLATTLSGAGLAAATPAAAATPVCAPQLAPTIPSFCIDALTVSPASVANNVDATVTVSVHVSSGNPACLLVGPPYGINAAGSEQPFALSRQGTAATWTGTYTSRAFLNKPGTYPWVQVTTCDANYIGAIDLDAQPNHGTDVAQPLVVTGTNDTAPPVLRSLSVTPTSVDATTKDATFAVTARLTDDYAGVSAASLGATPASVSSSLPGTLGGQTSGQLTRTAGTALDGTWTGTLKLAGGTSTTWALTVGAGDAAFNSGATGPAALAAAGWPSSLTTRTTAAPPTPAGLKATSAVALGGIHVVTITGTAQAAGKPMATAWQVTLGSGCGGTVLGGPPGKVTITRQKTGWQLCQFSVVALNAAGKAKAATVTALL